MNKKLLSLLLALICIFNFTFTSAYASADMDSLKDQSELSQKYTAESVSNTYGDKWEKIFLITLLDTKTSETSSLRVVSTKDGDVFEKEFIKNLPDNYKVDIETIENPNYTKSDFEVRFVDTIFDIGCLAMSVAEFAIEPSFWNGFNVVVDGLSVVLPGVPSVSGIKRMIKASDNLADAMRWGVARYDDLLSAKSGIPRYSNLQAHHILEKRFRPAFPEIRSDNSMLCINIPNTYHQAITNKMRSKIPYGTNYASMGKSRIIEKVIAGYDELYEETGDELYEFLKTFVEESDQFYTNTHVDINISANHYFDTY